MTLTARGDFVTSCAQAKEVNQMPTKAKTKKPQAKVRDLKPKKNPKGGIIAVRKAGKDQQD